MKITYTPVEGRIIIEPLKPKMIETEEWVAKEVNTGKPVEELDLNERVNYEEPIETTVLPEKIKREAIVRKAKVLAVSTDENRFKAGDTIVYRNGTGTPFELISKKAIIINKYDVLTIVE